MAMRLSAGAAKPACDINTTPLIDVMLVLLVTLIVSLPLLTHAVKLNLPVFSPSHITAPPAIELEIDADGTLVWNGSALPDLARLENYFHALGSAAVQPPIHLRPARHASYDLVARVMAAAQRNHLHDIGFVNVAEFKD